MPVEVFTPFGYTTLIVGDEPVAVDVPTGLPPAPDAVPIATAEVQWPVSLENTDIPLTAPLDPVVVVGSVFKIDDEMMTVTDISNIDNPVVTRSTFGTATAEHEAGATVEIFAGTAAPAGSVIRVYNRGPNIVSVMTADEPSSLAFDYGLVIPAGGIEYLPGGSVLSAVQVEGAGQSLLYIAAGN